MTDRMRAAIREAVAYELYLEANDGYPQISWAVAPWQSKQVWYHAADDFITRQGIL